MKPQRIYLASTCGTTMGVSRDKTIVVRKSEGFVPDYSTFCDLVESGAFCDPDTVRQVVKHNDEFHVSFTSKEVLMNVAANYKKETSKGVFYVDPVEKKRAYLKVYDLPYEVPSRSVSEALLPYGTVGEVTRDKFPGRNFLNGIRTVPIFLKDDATLPHEIVIEGFKGRVLNTSTPFCNVCKRNGHTRKECPELICNRCHEWGHFANRCPEAYCNNCHERGHWTRQCKPKQVTNEKVEEAPKKGKPSYADAAARVRVIDPPPAKTVTTSVTRKEKEKGKDKIKDNNERSKRLCVGGDGDGAPPRGMPPLPGAPVPLSNRFAFLPDESMDLNCEDSIEGTEGAT